MFKNFTLDCIFSGGSCECTTTTKYDIAQSGYFTSSGATITEDSGGGSYDYCLDDTRMDQSGNITSDIPGVALWKKS